MTKSMKGPFRTHDENGRVIVRVNFPGSPYRTYAYAVAEGVSAAVGDRLWAPGNEYSPAGAEVVVAGLGSEYAGELAVIERRADTPTVKLTGSPGPTGAEDMFSDLRDRRHRP